MSSFASESVASKPTETRYSDSLDLFLGGGEMGALIQAFDWAQTPLGPPSTWPQSLKTSLNICLASRFPIVLYWGSEYVVLYNDAYGVILGSKHPWALGQTCHACWAEIWETIGPMLEGVVKTGKATWSDDLLLMLERFDYPEECYFSFSFTPVQVENGAVGGVFTAVMETTAKVLSERRMRTLRDLAARAVEARTEEDAWQIVASTLAENRKDVPFAILCQNLGEGIRVTGAAGIDTTHPLCTALCRPGSELFQKAAQVVQSGQRAVLEDLGSLAMDLPRAPWNTAPTEAVLLPISGTGQGPSGVLLAAVSPAKKLDETYSAFFDLVARQIATSLADTRAYEEERKRAESLAELDRAKTLFFSNISHELRTPLTLVLGPTESALASVEGALRGEALRMVHRNELRLLKLVNALLDFSRIEAGRVQAAYEPTDVAGLTAQIAGVFHAVMEKAGLRFSVNCPPLREPVYVDREMWEKIVLNLLSNAFKFTLAGAIEISLEEVADGVQLQVKDTGGGIREAELPRIFERFYRVENAEGRSHEGSGIGLALVQELVKLHGGTIMVTSEYGKGSTFRVLVPRGTAHLPAERIGPARGTEPASRRAESYADEVLQWLPQVQNESTNAPSPASYPAFQPEGPAARSTDRATVLIVDDNADMRNYLRRLLTEHYNVIAAVNGEEAFAATLREKPDLILTDVMMPVLDGFGLLRAIRENPATSTIPVVVLSARAGEEAHIEGLQAGADDYLAKPFTARELIARVSSNLKLNRLRREAAEREARLRAQAELERRRLQELLAQAPAAIALLGGPRQHWRYVNECYVRLAGRRSAQDFIGKTARESLPELEGQHFFEMLDEVYQKGEPFFGHEMRAVFNRSAVGLPDESYWDFVCQPVRDAEGQVEGVLFHGVEVTDRVLSRKTIEQSEERLRLAQQAAAIGTFELDLESNVNRWTPELEAMYGLAPGTFPGTQEAWEEFVHPEDRAAVKTRIEDGFKTGTPVQSEWRVIWPDGSVHWLLGRWQVFKDRAGKPLRMIGVNIDVTEQKEAEEAQRRLAAIVESSEDAIAGKNLNGIITSWNKSAERLFGYTAEEIIGKPVTTISPPELHDDEIRILARVRAGGSIEHFETVRLHKDGRRLQVSLTVSPVRDGDGKIIGAAKIVRDITRQKKLEEAAVRLAAIVESSDDAIVSKDLNGIVTSWNKGAERIFGYRPEEIIGRSITLVIPPELLADEAMILGKIKRGERIEHFETVRLTKSGQRVEVSLSISPVRDDHGRIVGAAKIARDITENKKIERALRTTEKLAAAGRLAATVAHEINNPLEAVTNLVFLAQRDVEDRRRVAEYLDVAERELNRVAHITRQTLGFYRDTAAPRRFSVSETLDDLLYLYEKRLESRNIKVIRQYEQGAHITALAGELRQAFSNLISNSIDAMPTGGSLVLRVSKSHRNSIRPGVRVTVLDTGCGIGTEYAKSVFEPFFTTKADVGTGLGLWITKNIVEKHHGTIRFKSKADQTKHGTVFSIFVPFNGQIGRPGEAPQPGDAVA